LRAVGPGAEYSQSFARDALELFRLQYGPNAAYRKYCEALKVAADTPTDWKKIPAVPTFAFKELEFTSIPEGERTAVFHSSGTTEQRASRHFHNRESLNLYERTLVLPFKEHFLPDRVCIKLLSLTPRKTAAPHSSLVHMFESVVDEFGGDGSMFAGALDSSGAWTLNADVSIAAIARSSEEKEPIGILSTAFGLVFLLDELAKRKLRFRLPPGSRVLETGGYKGRSRVLAKEELHALIREFLGIPSRGIICEYGMCELSSQAYDRTYGQPDEEPRRFRFPSWARALVISPETGREADVGTPGLLRVIDLANVWSVLAVQTEDIVVQRGAGFELLGRASASEARGCSLMSV